MTTTISHYSSINDLLSQLSPEHRFLIEKTRKLLLKYGAKETLKSIHICYRFPNNMRFYINTYKKKIPILSCNCYRIFNQYPMIQHIFDTSKNKYISKILLRNEDIFEQKAIEQLIKLTSEVNQASVIHYKHDL